MKQRWVLWLVAVLVVPWVAVAAEKTEKSKPVCPVSGEEVSGGTSIDYKGAKLAFCCADCVKKFEKEAAKFEAKANAQLVATGQAKQKACPFTGKPVKSDVALSVAGSTVQFCCPGCKGKVAKAGKDEQVQLVYGKSFDKGFEITKK